MFFGCGQIHVHIAECCIDWEQVGVHKMLDLKVFLKANWFLTETITVTETIGGVNNSDFCDTFELVEKCGVADDVESWLRSITSSSRRTRETDIQSLARETQRKLWRALPRLQV